MRRSFLFIALSIVASVLAVSSLSVSPPDKPNVSGLVPGTDLTSPEALGWTREQADTAHRYSRGSWVLGFIDPLVGIGTLALLALTGFAGRLEKQIREKVSRRLASDSIFIVAMIVCL